MPTRMAKWSYTDFEGRMTRESELWLYPEINYSACVDEVYGESGEYQLQYFVQEVMKHCPEEWEADAVLIYWSVMPVHETAPFQNREAWRFDENFLSFFSWPCNPGTGENLDWYRLPVINDRFPKFAKALAWTPSPLQSYCPLRSIMESRAGHSPRERIWREANHRLIRPKRGKAAVASNGR